MTRTWPLRSCVAGDLQKAGPSSKRKTPRSQGVNQGVRESGCCDSVGRSNTSSHRGERELIAPVPISPVPIAPVPISPLFVARLFVARLPTTASRESLVSSVEMKSGLVLASAWKHSTRRAAERSSILTELRPAVRNFCSETPFLRQRFSCQPRTSVSIDAVLHSFTEHGCRNADFSVRAAVENVQLPAGVSFCSSACWRSFSMART